MATRFAHICFIVEDFSRAQAFYTGFFGLRFEKQIAGPDGHPICVFLALGDGVSLELLQRGAHGPMHGHLAFWVDDLVAFSNVLRDKGVAVTDPDLRPSGNSVAFLVDPDGNTIELVCKPRPV